MHLLYYVVINYLILKPNVLLHKIHEWPPENDGLCKIVLRPLCLQVISYLATLGDTHPFWPTRRLFDLLYPQKGSLNLDVIWVF